MISLVAFSPTFVAPRPLSLQPQLLPQVGRARSVFMQGFGGRGGMGGDPMDDRDGLGRGMGGFDGFNGMGGPGGEMFGESGDLFEGGQFFLLILVFLSGVPAIANTPSAHKLTDFVGVSLMVLGVILFSGSVSTSNRRQQRDAYALRTDGAYRVSRNPMGGGLVTGCLGLSILTDSPERLCATLLLYTLLAWKARSEEKKLEEIHGVQAFTAWKAKVPR